MAQKIDMLVRLDPEQKKFLENKSKKTNLSQAEIIRRAINNYITQKGDD